MNQNRSVLYVHQSPDTSLPSITNQLRQSGFQVIPTFDLHQTRTDEVGCTCPHHGTANCDCQMIVLLIYGEDNQPATLVVHGHEGQTWLSMVEFPDSTTTQLDTKIRDAFTSYEIIPATKDLF